MTKDQFIDAIMKANLYDVDLETGLVINKTKNTILKNMMSKFGYHYVSLYYNGKMQSVLVHRMIAIKVYGLNAVENKHIAHLDENKTNNNPNNLCPMTAAEHTLYDKRDKHLTASGWNLKTTWQPCVKCGEVNGRLDSAHKTPKRYNGEQFGFNGQLCWRCYDTLKAKERRLKNKMGR